MTFGDVFIETMRGYSLVKIYVGIVPMVMLYLTDCNEKAYLNKSDVCSVVAMFCVTVDRDSILDKLTRNDCTYSRCSIKDLNDFAFNVEDDLKHYMIKRQIQDGIRPEIVEDIQKYVKKDFGKKFQLLTTLRKGQKYKMSFDNMLYIYLGYKVKDEKVDTLPSFIREDGFTKAMLVTTCEDIDEYDNIVENEFYRNYYDYGMLKETYSDWSWYL